ncbi:tRNA methyltransferase complex subunit Cpd1 [Cylindrobasidium torrendii FP15055 ss-10]|uniref:tRNA (adenine(58)-N(1))-methyltransferase catalytic subunit TRM61 n=1 Tax=Cylindrobasidium torrendii FP15055 ss-10 TaxID=1314674 RepID=A0A0D7BN32_9AGAR|nr:tRNA methyltransferase complex subunit Cpd1 [Cylindrobasidium torrendii FP15055 ss-10]
MWSTGPNIADGDVIIVWLTRDLIQPLTVEAGKDFNSRFGNYKHDDFIGTPYGSKVGARSGRGFIHLLRPTPELWTMALPHRTQILYHADISFITSWLNIKKGSKVIEAGTGSGSFSHSVIRSIGSTGHLWSYEFHEARETKAREEFARHGFSDIVTLTHRNVCKDGFTVADTVDALFLDIPAPWDAIEHAKLALRKDCITRICCFSPCIEQVLRTVTALNEHGFTDITMYETLQRPHDVARIPAPKSIAATTEKLKIAEVKREERRLQQIADNENRRQPKPKSPNKRKRADEEDDEGQEDGGKKAKTHKAEDTAELMLNGGEQTNEGSVSVSRVIPEVRGHTSYLTFATLMPIPPVRGPPAAEATPAETPDGGNAQTASGS